MSNNFLGVYARPLVLFDPESKDHRRWAWQFFRDRSWKNCPVRFALPDGEDNVCTMIERLLMCYYSQREFGTIPQTDRERHYSNHLKQNPKIIKVIG
jgi:hypothetical protein